MVYKGKSQSKMDDDWAYPHLWKPTHRNLAIPLVRKCSTHQKTKSSVTTSQVGLPVTKPTASCGTEILGHQALSHRLPAGNLSIEHGQIVVVIILPQRSQISDFMYKFCINQYKSCRSTSYNQLSVLNFHTFPHFRKFRL